VFCAKIVEDEEEDYGIILCAEIIEEEREEYCKAFFGEDMQTGWTFTGFAESAYSNKEVYAIEQYCGAEDVSEHDSMPSLLARDHDSDSDKESNMSEDDLMPPLVPSSNLEMEGNSDDNHSVARPLLVPRRRELTNAWDSDDKLEDELVEEPDVRIKKEWMDDDTSIQMLTRVEDTNDDEEDLKEGMEDYLLDTGSMTASNVSHSRGGFCNIRHSRRTVKVVTVHLTIAE
jgi:hypothetical protein